MVRTASLAYLQTTPFIADVSVNVATDDIAYVGLGQATSDLRYYHEPSNCFLFRIHNVGFTGIIAAATHVGGEAHFLDTRMIGSYAPGTTEIFRIERDGDYVTLSIPSQNVSRTFSISQFNAQLGLTAENTCLFFGNTGVGTVFSNFRITRTATDDETSSSVRR